MSASDVRAAVEKHGEQYGLVTLNYNPHEDVITEFLTKIVWKGKTAEDVNVILEDVSNDELQQAKDAVAGGKTIFVAFPLNEEGSHVRILGCFGAPVSACRANVGSTIP